MSKCFFLFFLAVIFTLTPLVSADDPYTIPNGKTPQELLDYARKTIREYQITPDISHEKLMQEVAKQAKFVVNIADAALTQKPEKELQPQIYMFKFQGLLMGTRAEDTPENVQNLEKFLDELDTVLPNSRDAKAARLLDLQRRIDLFAKKNTSKAEYERLKQIFFSLIKQEPIDFPPGIAFNFVEFAEVAERSLKKQGLIDAASKELIAMLQSETSPIFREMIKQVDTATRRLGQEFVLEGIMLDRMKFDIKTLRGKVVLVDFFTSWCAPCMEEIPHLKEIYAKYHDKGFEIVGVGGDKSSAILKVVEDHKIPWRIVSEELTVGRNLPSIERQYGIKAYPTMFLLDQEGKLINTNARGHRLEAALERIFSEK